MSLNDISKNDEKFLKEFLKNFYRQINNIETGQKFSSIYQILNIIIAKYLLSFYYYKDIILNKSDYIAKEVEHIKNVHVTSQVYLPPILNPIPSHPIPSHPIPIHPIP